MARDKKSRLLKFLQQDVYVRVGRSETHGIGLFAIRDIPKGANPFKSLLKYDFIGLDSSELGAIPEQVQKMVHDYCSQENGKLYVPSVGFNPVHLLHFINHSNTPNVKAVGDGTKFIAVREIKKGEELYSDYSTYDEKSRKKI